ncbi:tyrosine-protein phosphatase [Histoplasma ohiense]|nr:tyrosine-protein phosphatase [Histoplasma ohiense (nom. inval.)]
MGKRLLHHIQAKKDTLWVRLITTKRLHTLMIPFPPPHQGNRASLTGKTQGTTHTHALYLRA